MPFQRRNCCDENIFNLLTMVLHIYYNILDKRAEAR